jgi:hypothetical protein
LYPIRFLFHAQPPALVLATTISAAPLQEPLSAARVASTSSRARAPAAKFVHQGQARTGRAAAASPALLGSLSLGPHAPRVQQAPTQTTGGSPSAPGVLLVVMVQEQV